MGAGGKLSCDAASPEDLAKATGSCGAGRTSRDAELGRQAQSSLPTTIHHLMGAALEGDVTLAFFL